MYIGRNQSTGMYYGRDKLSGKWTIAQDMNTVLPGKMKIVLKNIDTLRRSFPGQWECIRWEDAVGAASPVVARELDSRAFAAQKKVVPVQGIAQSPQSANLLAKLNELAEAVKQCDQEKMEEEIRRCDREVFDIYHEIERSNLDAARICRVYKRLRSALVRRRQLKDDCSVLKAIHGSTMDVLLQPEALRRLDDISRMAWAKAYDGQEGEPDAGE